VEGHQVGIWAQVVAGDGLCPQAPLTEPKSALISGL
jgi:hypothetical protein